MKNISSITPEMMSAALSHIPDCFGLEDGLEAAIAAAPDDTPSGYMVVDIHGMTEYVGSIRDVEKARQESSFSHAQPVYLGEAICTKSNDDAANRGLDK